MARHSWETGEMYDDDRGHCYPSRCRKCGAKKTEWPRYFGGSAMNVEYRDSKGKWSARAPECKPPAPPSKPQRKSWAEFLLDVP